MNTVRKGTNETIKRRLAEHHDRQVTSALKEIERIVGDSASLDGCACDLIRGAIAGALYNQINGG